MNCKESREILNVLMDGESHALAAQAEAHAMACPDCRAWRESTENVMAFVQDDGDMPDFDLSAAVMSKLPVRHPAAAKQARYSNSPRRRLIGWVAAFFSLLILACASVYLKTGENSIFTAVDLCQELNVIVTKLAVAAGSISLFIKPFATAISGIWAAWQNRAALIIIGVSIADVSIMLGAYAAWKKRSALNRIASILG